MQEAIKNWPTKTKSILVGGKRIYHPVFFRWRSMVRRCESPSNKQYYLYGGRGIKVCTQWKDFWTFVKWVYDTYEEGKSIDRIDNSKGYSPNNCRWATPLEQQINARITTNKLHAIKKAQQFRKDSNYKDLQKRNRCLVTGRFL